jgi:hypothetical protein
MILKHSQSLRVGKRKSQKFFPTSKIGSNTQRAIKPIFINLIYINKNKNKNKNSDKLLNPWFHPCLRHFPDSLETFPLHTIPGERAV